MSGRHFQILGRPLLSKDLKVELVNQGNELFHLYPSLDSYLLETAADPIIFCFS